MAIIRTLRVKDGESLCSIAVENGFKNCTKLRTANPPLANREAEPGDKVDVPEVTGKQEAGAVDQLHRFRRLGRANRVWIIEDRNRASGTVALNDTRIQVGVSNYVTGRQGRDLAPDPWRDTNFFGFSAGASADPDHFRILVHDLFAARSNTQFVDVTVKTQRPILGAIPNEIQSWQDLTQAGTTLTPVRCQRFNNTAFYRSPYLRLVVDDEDRQLLRNDGRINIANDNGGTANDTGTAVTNQVLLTPALDDPDIEILDFRIVAERPAPDCQVTAANARCRARFRTAVGKEELELKLKVVRVGGVAGSGASDNQIRQMVFVNLRNRYAQANIGVKQVQEPGPGVTIVQNFIHDVTEPRNMIAISDFDGLPATGGKTLQAQVTLSSGTVTASITTDRQASPTLTAGKLAVALRAQGVTCRVMPNPPIIGSPRPFGSCDILCFNADGTMAPISTVTPDPAEAQTITSSAAWTNNRVRDEDVYNTPADPNRGGKARMIGSIDYRSAAKNFNRPGQYLCAIVTKRLETAGLNGEAILPHFGISANVAPVPEFRLVVFLSQGGYTSPVTLSHEGGHALCDCFHTSVRNGAGNEEDHDGNIFCNNASLGFSEWMSAFARTRPIRKRISDGPLKVWLLLLKTGIPRVEAEWHEMGGRRIGNPPTNLPAGSSPNPTPTERLRTHSGGMFVAMRDLHEQPVLL
jgi:hypothetical protein